MEPNNNQEAFNAMKERVGITGVLKAMRNRAKFSEIYNHLCIECKRTVRKKKNFLMEYEEYCAECRLMIDDKLK